MSIFFWKLLTHKAHVHLFDWRCWQGRLLSSLGTKHWNRTKVDIWGVLEAPHPLLLVEQFLLDVSVCFPVKCKFGGFFQLSPAEIFTLFAIYAVIQYLSQGCPLGTECHNKALRPRMLPWNKRKILIRKPKSFSTYCIKPAWAFCSVCRSAISWRLSWVQNRDFTQN